MERVIPVKTVWRATVKTPWCGGTHVRDFPTEEEALAYGEGPESAGLVCVERRTIIDPEEERRRWREYARIRDTSCLMPPDEDLVLLRDAKALPPERYAEIDEGAARWKQTRVRLREVKMRKFNELCRRRWSDWKDTP